MKYDDNGTEVEIIKPKSKKDKDKSKEKKSNDNKNFISPIIRVVIGILFLTNSNNVIIYSFYIIGAIVISFGIYNILNYAQTKSKLKFEDTPRLTIGCILFTIGLVVILISRFILVFINIVVGGALIYTGIIKLLNIDNYKKKEKNFKLVESIIYIAMGLYSIMFQNIVLVIIGVWLTITSLIDIYDLLKK